uniref:Single-stranded DNA binding protein n=1 Tax=Roundia cardiophora TaxID=1403802 RepID=A0A089VJP7_9STRA|nr:hypothetical protein Ycf41 [Roundia cardiophora]AIR75877.1 hypothetical protein Ycf41 [Roundia cardiophora]
MNYVIFAAKVLKNAGQSFFKDGTSLTELTVQLPQIKKNNTRLIAQISVWGRLSYDSSNYYKLNDYIIVEGYISFRNSNIEHTYNSINKQVEISAFKIYPLRLKLSKSLQ